MEQQIRRDNHYVPIWYQKRFISAPKSTYFYLDLNVTQDVLPNGKVTTRREVSTYAPAACFKVYDLYTTQFGNTLNDEIEKLLFGAIDDDGAIAVRAFADGNPSAIHKSFQSFFVYLDALKLRTPKGLDWIKGRYPGLTQLELMLEMQGLRQMHCAMWTEGVREIVLAKDSEVKFIVTDHPVTVYNASLSPHALIHKSVAPKKVVYIQ